MTETDLTQLQLLNQRLKFVAAQLAYRRGRCDLNGIDAFV